ncbi:hypothetical protein L6164_034335 [Bauhinia variegata]|uniref:Uncharacterized protein n=1 Tax=Bauhinia variegata TaxID=167791 RepID=A0ACB9KUJ0_BAUVA|nr:hypothetical protein L6164_034335 [Bauhinia variegata]
MSQSQSSLTAIHNLPFHPKFKDDRQTPKLSMVYHGNAEQSTEVSNNDDPLPHNRRGAKVKLKHKLKKGFHTSDLGNSNNRSDIIQIRSTDRVIHDIEKMLCNTENPDPVELEKAN